METEIDKPESQVRLVGMTGPYRDCVYLVKKDEFLIGRAPECQLVLEETTISARHARIVRRGEQYELQDLQSTNGTYVEGVKIDVKKLRNDDRIRFDRLEFRFLNPLDVSRTVVGEAPALDAVKKTVFRGPAPAAEPAAPSPRPSPAPPQPVQAAAARPQPPEAARAASEREQAHPGSAAGAVGGLILGLVIAYLLGAVPLLMVTFVRTASELSAIPRLISQVVGFYPGMHLHPAWINADWRDPAVVLTAICLFLGLFLGGLITQNAWRRSRFAAAFSLALGYVLLSLLLQAATIGFKPAGLPMNYPLLFPALGAWGNFAVCAAYFFAVALVVAGFGALLGRKKR